jgi:hypothetical protein
VRTRDDDDGDGALGDEVAASVGEEPHDGRDETGADGHVREDHCGAVGDVLRSRFRCLRLRDEPHDAGERGLIADARDADPKRSRTVDRAGDRLGTRTLAHRPRLSCERGLVNVGLAIDDLTVGGDAAARSHEHDVALSQLGDGYLFDPVTGDPVGRVGQELRQLRQRAFRTPDRAHLDPVTEQHDVHERRELPVEALALDPERRRYAVEVGRGDAYRDERHHAGQTRLDLVCCGTEEDRAAVEVDRRRQDERDDLAAGKLRRRQAEQVPQALRIQKDRDRQDEADPEPGPEHLDGVTGVAVVSSVAAVRVPLHRVLRVRVPLHHVLGVLVPLHHVLGVRVMAGLRVVSGVHVVADVDVVTRMPDVGGCGHVRGVVVVVGAVIRRRVVLVISAHAPPTLAQSSRVPHHAEVEPHLLRLQLRAPIAVIQLRAVPSAGRHAGAAKGRTKARTAKGRRDRTWQQVP